MSWDRCDMIKEGASAWNSALFRRQFVAGPRPLPRFEAWRQCAIGPLHVHCHPDLPVSTAACGDRRLVLLGEVFDYSRPSDGNQAVADRLIAQAEEFTDLEAEMAKLAGRWLAFASMSLGSPGLSRCNRFKAGVLRLGRRRRGILAGLATPHPAGGAGCAM